MSINKGAVLVTLFALYQVQCRSFPQPRLPLGLAERRDNDTTEVNGLGGKSANLLMVVQSKRALHSVDSVCVADSATGDNQWTVNHFYANSTSKYWANHCTNPLKEKYSNYPDETLYKEIWPNICSKSPFSPTQNIENRYLEEGSCAIKNEMWKRRSSCYDKKHKSFAQCYYEQVETLFQYAGASTEIPIINSTTQTDIPNASEVVQKMLTYLFESAPIDGIPLTPNLVKKHADNKYVYLGCQQTFPGSASDTASQDTTQCTITRVGLCFRCFVTGSFLSCTPTSNNGIETAKNIPGELTSCSNVPSDPNTVPWDTFKPCDNKEYSCYDQSSCARVIWADHHN